MTHKKLSRREFLVGCSATIAAFAGARLTRVAFGRPTGADSYNQEILIVIFLRGGWDALNVLSPLSGDDRGYYEANRPSLQIPTSGENAALTLDGQFGLHPAMLPLHGLYQDGKLAMVHAAGLTSDTRSHFDAMQYIELGTPGSKFTTTGWLTRHLQSASNLPPSIMFPALSAGYEQAQSLLGSYDAIAMSNPDSFSFDGHWNYEDAQRQTLRHLYDGDTWLYQAGTQTLDAVDMIASADPGDYTPANGAVYPSGDFGDNLQVIAQMIKLNLGMRVATVDLGGWDTHENQGDGAGGYLATMLGELSEGLAALYTDLNGTGEEDYTQKVTAVVMSEFGRRLKENYNEGTDHGHGGVMLVLGGNVNGGQVYGEWPGLHSDQLYDRADLAVTTDFRRILSEILIRRLGNPYLGYVFPGYSNYEPLGIVQGDDLEPLYGFKTYLPLVRGDS